MAVIVASNNAASVLALPLNVGSTTLTLSAGTGALFPAVTAPNFFKMTITNAGETLREIVNVTARSGDVLTIQRGQESTTALAWNAGDKIENLLTAQTLAKLFNQDVGGVLTGTLPNPGMAVGVAASNLGPAGGDLQGTYPNPTFNLGLTHAWTAIQKFVGGVIGSSANFFINNNANNANNLVLSDAGTLSIRASIFAGAGIGAGTSISAGTSITAGTTISTTSGDITANGGKLRASLNSGGDTNAATLLGEFTMAGAGIGIYGKFPAGLVVQAGGLNIPEQGIRTFNFPTAFPNVCLGIAGGAAAGLASLSVNMGTCGISPINNSQFNVEWATSVVTGADIGGYWIAIGY